MAPAVLDAVSIRYPQLLGNGRDVAQQALAGPVGVLALVVLRPAATVMCLDSGVPGGLFTPALAVGAAGGVVVCRGRQCGRECRPGCSR